MSEYTSEELAGVLRAVLAGWNEVAGWDHWSEGMIVTVPLFGVVEVVQYSPGSTDYDDGIPTVIIFKLSDYDFSSGKERARYYRKSGYTSSHGYGTSWTGEFREVVPQEKVVYEYV